jgi:septum formation inhibitor MinC
VIATQIVTTYKMLAAISTDMTITSKQCIVSQNDFVVLSEVKAIALYSNDT